MADLPNAGTARDRASRTSQVAKSTSMLTLKTLVKIVRAVLPASVLILATVLVSVSGQFYELLGVNPNDVGLGFDVKVLTSSPGMVLLGLLLLGYLMALVLFALARRPSAEQPHRTLKALMKELEEWLTRPAARIFTMTALSLGLVVVVVQAYGILQTNATHEARLVKQGSAVKPYRFLGFVMIPIHAEPAFADWTGDSNASSISEELKDRSMMYLGRANGIIVLYDYLDQEAIFVQESSVVLRVMNCEAPNEHPGCH